MSQLLGVAQSTLSMFLTNNPDLKDKHCQKQGKQLMASKALIPEFTVRKGLRQGSVQFRETKLKDAKDQMVNMAKDNASVVRRLELYEKMIPSLVESVQRLQATVEALTVQREGIKQLGVLSESLLPEPKKDVPDMNTRAAINKFIREQAVKQNRYINILWSELYSQFYSRYGINITMRAKKKEMTVIEYAEEYDHLDDLYALARKIYKN
jgi:hypothetical protein